MHVLKSFGILFLILAFAGCSSSKPKSSNDKKETAKHSNEKILLLHRQSDRDTAGELGTVFFNTDSATFNYKAKTILGRNSEYLHKKHGIHILIEGHTDERGGIQHNLALGEKRAKAVRNHLVALGIEKKRISIVSFGKEKLLEVGHDESVWEKNRRANFVITEME